MRIVPPFLTKQNAEGWTPAGSQTFIAVSASDQNTPNQCSPESVPEPIAFHTQVPRIPINKIKLSYALTGKVSLRPFPISLCVTNGNLETVNLFVGLQAQKRRPVLTLERLV